MTPPLLCPSLLLAAFLAPSLAAQAPSPRMARLTVAQGYVHIARPDSPAGDPAQLNMPLTEGQSIVTGDDGQAEIEFEDGSVARLTPHSTLALAHLTASGTDTDTQLTLAQGLAYFELRAAAGITFGVSAGDERLAPVENTTLRVNLDQPPPTVAILAGRARLERKGGTTLELNSGETFRADPADAARYFLAQQIAADTWDTWNETLDQQAADAAARQTPARGAYAGAQGYGWSDLDTHGTWYDVAGQGPVWQPDGGESADFDPYGNGSWVWYPTGGYLWASAYPWGWTPFRCGGWSFFDTFGWGWAPGTGCGGFGFAGGGGFGYGGGRGGYINILHNPLRHPLPHPPPPGRSGVHPIVTVHTGTLLTARQAPSHNEPRWVNGRIANPLPPASLGYTVRGGSLAGSPLHRDFPVDRSTRTPVLGLQSSPSAFRDRDEPAPTVGGTLTSPQRSPITRNPAPVATPLRSQPPPPNSTYIHPAPAQQRPPQYSAPRPAAPPPSRPAFTPAPAPAHVSAPAPSGKK